MDHLEHEDGREAWEELAGVKTFRVVNEAGENMADAVCRQMADGRWLHSDNVDGYFIMTEHENGNLTLVPDAESVYRVAFVNGGTGEFDIQETFSATDNEDANCYAETKYPLQPWFVLDEAGQNING